MNRVDAKGQKIEYMYNVLGDVVTNMFYASTNAGSPEKTVNFAYDFMGNRTSEQSAETYSVNNLNQYTQIVDIATNTLIYDLNGNMLQRVVNGVTNYLAWDIQDRLTEIRDVESNLVARYYYDPFGRRLSKTVFSGASSNVTYFLYADEGLVAEFDEAGNEIRFYGYAPGSMWMNNPLYLQVSGLSTQVYFYLTDHLGAPQKLVDKNGAVVWSMVSESFGKTVVSPNSTVTNNLRFSSQYFDAESGLHYNTIRYYDPEAGRYLTRDTIQEMGGINLYEMGGNSLLNGIDTYGENFTPGGAGYGTMPAPNPDIPNDGVVDSPTEALNIYLFQRRLASYSFGPKTIAAFEKEQAAFDKKMLGKELRRKFKCNNKGFFSIASTLEKDGKQLHWTPSGSGNSYWTPFDLENWGAIQYMYKATCKWECGPDRSGCPPCKCQGTCKIHYLITKLYTFDVYPGGNERNKWFGIKELRFIGKIFHWFGEKDYFISSEYDTSVSVTN